MKKTLMSAVVLLAFVIGLLPSSIKQVSADYWDPVSTYHVDSNGDGDDAQVGDGICADALVDGHCTLRAAIREANSTPALDKIDFNITYSEPLATRSACPGGPLEVICPKNPLPSISYRVIIDGTSQTGWQAGTPIIELDGNNDAIGPGVDAFILTAGESIIRGLWIHSFTDNGIDISFKGGNIIEGNWIGNADGEDANEDDDDVVRGRNYSDGIFIHEIIQSPAGNIVGGTTLEQRNVITGNGYNVTPRTDAYGITISGSGASDNVIQGNYIGVEPDGARAEGNTKQGVQINGAPGNTVGGTSGTTPGGECTGACNVISDNDGGGILITGAGATGNVVEGNFIGTTVSGLVARGNAVTGVHIDDASSNTVGGTTAAGRNIISRNGGIGVKIEGATSTGNFVEGNYIGLSSTGLFIEEADLGNTGDGVNINAGSNNTIGGTAGVTPGGPCTGACNAISDNGGRGIQITGSAATGNVVEGNYVGLDSAGDASGCGVTPHYIGNTQDGVYINGASGNRIGGTTEAARNFVGCNGADQDDAGIEISGSGAQSNVVVGNTIGLTPILAPAGNIADGVRIAHAHNNTVGGSAEGEGNIIANNGWAGVQIRESDAHDNVVRGNIISGNLEGVYMNVAHTNIIGGTAASDANVITRNTRGVTVYGATGTGNIIQGNFIGTNASGDSGLGNFSDGVFLSSAPLNTIGGTDAGARNVISGNGASGIDIYQSGAAGNIIAGNYIGTDPTGSEALANSSDGIWINDAASNIIGGTSAAASNVISANGGNGVNISGFHATANMIQGNRIGTGAAGSDDLGNHYDGVRVGAYSSGTIIGGTTAGAGNIIAFNDSNGVLADSSVGNPILGNTVFSNQALGIDLVTAMAGFGPNWPQDHGDGEPPAGDTGLPDADTGGNNYQNFPELSQAVAEGGSTTIQGTFNSTPSTSGFRLEFFSNEECDPLGFGEGQTYLTSTTVNTDAGGNATINLVLPSELADGLFITATATDPSNNTSEFSECEEVTGPPDADSDDIPDSVDNCPFVANTDQADMDFDDVGDVCDPDMDGDGFNNDVDVCPLVYDPEQTDSDSDGIGNACDTDDDGDDVDDVDDDCPAVYDPLQEDGDGDGYGDACDVCSDLHGDANGSGAVSMVDAMRIAQYIAGLIGGDDIDQTEADANCSGTVTMVDAMRIAQYMAEIIDDLSCPP